MGFVESTDLGRPPHLSLLKSDRPHLDGKDRQRKGGSETLIEVKGEVGLLEVVENGLLGWGDRRIKELKSRGYELRK